MKFSFTLIFNLFFFVFGATTIKADEYRLRHEYKFSFKGPGMSKGIPFWNLNGGIFLLKIFSYFILIFGQRDLLLIFIICNNLSNK